MFKTHLRSFLPSLLLPVNISFALSAQQLAASRHRPKLWRERWSAHSGQPCPLICPSQKHTHTQTHANTYAQVCPLFCPLHTHRNDVCWPLTQRLPWQISLQVAWGLWVSNHNLTIFCIDYEYFFPLWSCNHGSDSFWVMYVTNNCPKKLLRAALAALYVHGFQVCNIRHSIWPWVSMFCRLTVKCIRKGPEKKCVFFNKILVWFSLRKKTLSRAYITMSTHSHRDVSYNKC